MRLRLIERGELPGQMPKVDQSNRIVQFNRSKFGRVQERKRNNWTSTVCASSLTPFPITRKKALRRTIVPTEDSVEQIICVQLDQSGQAVAAVIVV